MAGRISLVLVNDQDCRLAIGDRDKREGRYLGGRESSASGEQTDDCIFFSRILADDLLEYGKRLRRRHAWRLRLALPSVAPADWSEAERQGLLPANSEYAQWLKGFQRKPTRLKRFATGAWDGLVHVATWLGQGFRRVAGGALSRPAKTWAAHRLRSRRRRLRNALRR